jgi:hypothetical protein
MLITLCSKQDYQLDKLTVLSGPEDLINILHGQIWKSTKKKTACDIYIDYIYPVILESKQILIWDQF